MRLNKGREFVATNREELSAVIEPRRPDATRGQAASGRTAFVEDNNVMTRIVELASGGQPCETGPNDDNAHQRLRRKFGGIGRHASGQRCRVFGRDTTTKEIE